MFTPALFTIANRRKQLKCAVRDKQILKRVTHTRIFFRPKKKIECDLLPHKKVLPFATTWTELKDIMLTEISQRKTDTT